MDLPQLRAANPDSLRAGSDVREAFTNAITGAPGSQTAVVAEQVYQIWGAWLASEVEKIETIALKLEETCADYRATDEGVGRSFEDVVPGGGWNPPGRGPGVVPSGAGGGGSFEDVVPGGGWNPPDGDQD